MMFAGAHEGIDVMTHAYPGMVLIEGGEFSMGSERFYPEERPVRRARVESFWIDEVPVTNAAFRAFVGETGYVSVAERPAPGVAARGSNVFTAPTSPVNLADPSQWWQSRPGACWRCPSGAGSDLAGLDDHPVVHIAFADALAYAAWAGKQLPSEAQWEYAARGGLDGVEYAWGNALAPDGLMLANTWQGEFPWQNTRADGWAGTSPVRSYPGNGYGLFDMIGNVWEWTSDSWSMPRDPSTPKCCSGREINASDGEGATMERKVIKGGSHLCAANYCQRYRPAARYPQAPRETASHIGFRCVVRAM